MKRFLAILLLLLAICAAAFRVTSMQSGIQSGGVENGVLDLREIDLTAQVVSLAGEWEFVYGELLAPDEFPDSGGVQITVPASWSAAGYPTFGCGTYRLTLQADADDLLLFLPAIDSAAIVYVNGLQVYSAGEVSASRAEARAGVGNGFVPVSAEDGMVELVVQASNYDIWESGLIFPPLIGQTTPLLRHTWGQRLAVTAVMGGILLIGLYHLILFLFRRREKTYLAFCVTCVLVVLRLMLDNNAPLQFLLPGGAGLALLKGYALMFCLNIISIVVFMMLAFEMKPGRKTKWFFALTLGLPVAASFCPAPIPFLGLLGLMLPLAVTLVMGARRVEVRRNPYRLLYLCSIAVFLGNGLILGNGEMAKLLFGYSLYATGAAPNLFMILCQFVMLSQSYAAAHDEVERVNETLEATVEERTAELQDALTQVAHSERSVKELIGNISHDLKTPLTVVSLELQRLTDPTSHYSEEETRRMLSIAHSKTLDLRRLTQSLFDAAYMEESRVSYKLNWMRLGDLMGMLYDRYSDYVESKGRMLAIRYSGDMEIWLDRDNIWPVFENTINNALRYTPQDGTITVTAERAGRSHVELIIRDNGCGIEPEHLPRVFDRHYKADKSRGQGGDSGLGLYIVKSVVEGMEGTVRAESPPGEGASIIVTLRARESKI